MSEETVPSADQTNATGPLPTDNPLGRAHSGEVALGAIEDGHVIDELNISRNDFEVFSDGELSTAVREEESGTLVSQLEGDPRQKTIGADFGSIGEQDSPSRKSTSRFVSDEDFEARIDEDQFNQLSKSSTRFEKKYQWLALTSSYISRVRSLYTPPNAAFDQSDSVTRIILLSGPKHSGRFFAAAGFSRNLSQAQNGSDANLYRLRYERNCIAGLLSIVTEDPELPQNSCLIVEDLNAILGAFDDLSEENVSLLEEVLEKKNSYLLIIFESNSEGMAYPWLSRCTHLLVGHERSDAEREQFLTTVLKNHIKFDEEFGNGTEQLTLAERAAILSNLASLVSEFRLATQINRFCNSLALHNRKTEERDDEVVVRLQQVARQIAAINNSYAQKWFLQLTVNEKLFALLTILLKGMPCQQIRNVYYHLCTKLRSDRFPIEDPRASGYYDLLRRLQIEEESNGLDYRLLNSSFQAELEYQLQNHRDLLSGTVLVFFSLASQFDVRTGRLVGPIIARLLRHDWPALEREISVFLSSTNDRASQSLTFIPADALAESFTYHREAVLKILESWLSSNDIRRIWMTIITIGECIAAARRSDYRNNMRLEEDCRLLQGLLKRAVLWQFPWAFFGEARDGGENKFGLIHALGYTLSIFRESLPSQYVSIIRDWGQEYSSSARGDSASAAEKEKESELVSNETPISDDLKRRWLRIIIRKFARFTLAEYRDIDIFQQPSLEWVRDLAFTLLVTEPEPLGNDWINESDSQQALPQLPYSTESDKDEYGVAIECIVNWMVCCTTPKSQIECENWIGQVVQQCSSPQRRKFAKYLKQYGLEIPEETRGFCDSVLMRMLVLDGIPVDSCQLSHGIILIHGQTSDLNRLRLYARKVQQRIAHFSNLKSGVLGDTRLIDNNLANAKGDAYEGMQSRPPLAMPILEQLSWEKVPFVLVICADARRAMVSSNPVIDLDDLIRTNPEGVDKIVVVKEVREGQKASEAAGGPSTGISVLSMPFDHSKGPKQLEFILSRKVRLYLVARSQATWEKILEVTPPLDTTRYPPQLVAKLDELATEITCSSGFESVARLYRQISGLLQLLRIVDVHAYCALIRKWLQRSDANYTDLAKGAILLAIRVLRFEVVARPDEMETLLKLWPTIVSNTRLQQEALALLELVCSQFAVEDSEADNQPSIVDEIQDFCQHFPVEWRQDGLDHVASIIKGEQNLLQKLKKDSPKTKYQRNEKKLWLAETIRRELLLGPKKTFKPSAGTEYILIVVETSEKNQVRRAMLACRYHDLLRRHFSAKKVQPILYRMGINEPVGVSEKCSPDFLLPAGLVPSPNLVMPIIEQYSPEQLRTIVILSSNTPYDWDDAEDYLQTLTAFIPESPRQKFPANSWIVPLKDAESLERIDTKRDRIDSLAKDLLAKTILLN